MDPTTQANQSLHFFPFDPRVNKRPAIWVASVTKSHTFQWRVARIWRNPSSLDPPNLQVCLSEPQFTGLQWCLDLNKADSAGELQRMFLSMEFILYVCFSDLSTLIVPFFKSDVQPGHCKVHPNWSCNSEPKDLSKSSAANGWLPTPFFQGTSLS